MSPSTAMDRSEAAASLPSEALVLGVDGDRVRVRLAGLAGLSVGGAAAELRARVAVPGYVPAEGDRVLVQHAAEGGSVYILGVLLASRGPTIVTAAGASASIEGERIALRDAAGRLLLTLDAATGELALVAEKDLRLAAPAGRVVVEAQGDVELTAGAALRLRGPSLAVAVGHYELRAERIIERATDAFHTVEGVLEIRARHARTLVSRTLELLGRRTTIASEEDTRIEGKRVLLG